MYEREEVEEEYSIEHKRYYSKEIYDYWIKCKKIVLFF